MKVCVNVVSKDIGRYAEEGATLKVVQGRSGEYLCFTHGESGRNRWEIRIPVAMPADKAGEAIEFVKEKVFGIYNANAKNNTKEKRKTIKEVLGTDVFDLKITGKTDPRGNPLMVLVPDYSPDARTKAELVFWHLSPGYRGGASFRIDGSAKVLAKGAIAQGDAGRMGGADAPVLLVEGPCSLHWKRSGRLYGTESEWEARFDGGQWHIAPASEMDTEDILEDTLKDITEGERKPELKQ